MANYAYERLSAQDASFLLFETPNEHMHLAWLWAFDPGPLTSADGGVDIKRIRNHVASRLYLYPRFRQKLAYTPVENHPVWVDDESFKIHYHVQHSAVPDPGDPAQLWTTTSTLLSQPLDFSKPLWELHVIEGLANGRFAIVSKTHHCMVDGNMSADLMTGLLDDTPDAPELDPPDWIPRPAPGTSDLLFDTIRDRAALAVDFGRTIRDQIGGLREALSGGLQRAPSSPINQTIGPHRLVSGVRFPRPTIDAAAETLGGTVDDVALAIVAGGLQRYLGRQAFDTSTPLRVAMPAGRPRKSDEAAVAQVLSLPTNLTTPAEKVAALAEARREADEHAPSLERASAWLRLAEAAGHTVFGLGIEVRKLLHSFNLIVTALPGPEEPRYLIGSKLIAAYPQIPLYQNQCVSIGVASYDGQLHVGVSVDWETVPDLVLLISDLQAAYEEIATHA